MQSEMLRSFSDYRLQMQGILSECIVETTCNVFKNMAMSTLYLHIERSVIGAAQRPSGLGALGGAWWPCGGCCDNGNVLVLASVKQLDVHVLVDGAIVEAFVTG